MKIDIHISDATPDEVLKLFGGRQQMGLGDLVHALHTTEAPSPGIVGTSADVVVVLDEPAAAPVDGREDPAALIARLEYKPAKTVTLKGGVQGEVGDEVHADDGEVGVLEAVYRGRAVVLFDDGMAKLYPATELTAVPQADVKAPPPAATKANGAAAPEPDEGPAPGAIKAAAQRLIETLTKAKGKELIDEILNEFEADSLDQVDPEHYEELVTVLREEAAA